MDPFQMPEVYEHRAYDRALYIQLKAIVDRIQQAMDSSNEAEPPPPDSFFKDKLKYVLKHALAHEIDTAEIAKNTAGGRRHRRTSGRRHRRTSGRRHRRTSGRRHRRTHRRRS
jgi:hypothetical protein